MNNILRSLRMFVWMALLTGILYPLAITFIAQITLADKANGSIVVQNNKVIGSLLIAQKFEQTKYFWPRPSSGDYNPMASGGSNLSPTSLELKKVVRQRQQKITVSDGVKDISLIPGELLYASASGLDPDISPEAAYFQVDRVVKARGRPSITSDSLHKLIDSITKRRALGFIGQPCVNVLELNSALDEIK
jgi:K+-transporting ATPase ATPase C chain